MEEESKEEGKEADWPRDTEGAPKYSRERITTKSRIRTASSCACSSGNVGSFLYICDEQV